MKTLATYQTLITQLPVREQCFTTKRSTWVNFEHSDDEFKRINNSIFKSNDIVCISRNDLFKSNSKLKEFIIKTIYWGYSGGMRGNNFSNILSKVDNIENELLKLKQIINPTSNDFFLSAAVFKNITGLGLSTYSKLLHFLEITIDGYPCLILDQRLIDIFKNRMFSEYQTLEAISSYNKIKLYPKYLELTNSIASKFQTNGGNIEQFLFIFGGNLKN